MTEINRRQWSYSSLSKYEQCPYRYKLSKIDGIEEPVGQAATRGTRIHQKIESYLRHESNALPDLVQSTFGDELERAREQYAEPELSIALDREWKESPWDDAWVRAQLDMVIRDKSIVVDFKTGRYYPTHRDQASLYALLAMISETTEDAFVEFWYVDLDDVVTWEFNRNVLPDLIEKWEYKAKQLEEETNWEPRPGRHCRWCAFASMRGGQCVFGE